MFLISGFPAPTQAALVSSSSLIWVEPWTVDTVLPHMVSRLSTFSGLPFLISSRVPKLKKSTKSSAFSRSGVSFMTVKAMSMFLASSAGMIALKDIGLKTMGLPICLPSASARSTIIPCSVVPSLA